MAVYRNYDQAALDAQYNNRARVPAAADYIERWTALSQRARAAGPAELDVAYGAHPRHRLDIFPVDRVGAPTLVFIHGGYWHMLDKSGYSYPAPAFAAAGIHYVAIGYPLAPEVPIAGIVASVRDGLAWLWRHGAAHGLDPDRLYLAGHSAGGHLTAMAMATDWTALDDGLPDDLAKGGCAISGLYDLEPIRLSYLNENLKIAAGEVAAISPITQAAARRLEVVVGGAESEEYLRQAEAFHAVWRGAGGSGGRHVIDGADHFSIVDSLADPASELFAVVAGLCRGA